MKVCVYGAGAIGGHLAARLALGGAEVSLVARGALLAAIQGNGLTVHAHDGVHISHPKASANPADLGPQDAVIVTVKAPALPDVAAGIAPLLRADTPVAFVMNGIPFWYFFGQPGLYEGTRLPEVDPGAALEHVVGLHRTIGGVVYSATEVIAPGVVRSEHGNIRVILGEVDGRISDRAQEISAVLEKGGMPCPVSPDIRLDLWCKLLGNLGNGPLCTLAQRGVRDTYADPLLRNAARISAEEGRAVAAAFGIDVPQAIVERVVAANMTHKPSILQDLEIGRPMEIDGIFALPLRMARMAGVATPQLDLLVALMKQVARSRGLYPDIAGS